METKERTFDPLQKEIDFSDPELLGGLHLYPEIVLEAKELGTDVIPSWPSFGYEKTEE